MRTLPCCLQRRSLSFSESELLLHVTTLFMIFTIYGQRKMSHATKILCATIYICLSLFPLALYMRNMERQHILYEYVYLKKTNTTKKRNFWTTFFHFCVFIFNRSIYRYSLNKIDYNINEQKMTLSNLNGVKFKFQKR